MENHQFAFVSQITAKSLTFLQKFYGGDRLPAAAIFDGNQQNSPHCAICLDDICGGDAYRKLAECGHCFHSKCIDAWFRSHSTCPLCRTQVPQIISLNENQFYQWNALLGNVLLLAQDFVHKMCNPLNDELTSMMCGNVRYT